MSTHDESGYYTPSSILRAVSEQLAQLAPIENLSPRKTSKEINEKADQINMLLHISAERWTKEERLREKDFSS